MRVFRRNTPGSGRRRGNAVMEAALVLPILLSLSFGTVEYGYFFYVKHTLQGAARDGTRVAILPSSTNASVYTAIDNTMNAAGFVNVSGNIKYTTTITTPAGVNIPNVGTAATGTAIKVQVTCTWGTVGIRPMAMIASNKQVIGFTIMVKE